MNMRHFIILLLAALTLTACASTPKFDTSGIDASITPQAAVERLLLAIMTPPHKTETTSRIQHNLKYWHIHLMLIRGQILKKIPWHVSLQSRMVIWKQAILLKGV